MHSFDMRVLNQDEYHLWDDLVDSVAHATYFHRSNWLQKTSRILGVKPRIYGYFIDKSLVGGCSLYLECLWPGMVLASSINQCSPHGGLVVDQSGVPSSLLRERLQHALGTALCEEFKRDAFDHIVIQAPPGLNDIRIFTWNGWKCRVQYTYRLQTLEPNYSRTARKHISLATRLGIRVERSRDIDLFSALLKAMYAAKGLTPFFDIDRLRPLFEDLVRTGDGELWVARDSNGEVLAADLIICDTKRAYRWSAASRPERKLNGAVFLLLATIIESLRSRSIPEFLMMTANVPELAEFTAKFNPDLVPYFHLEILSKRCWFNHCVRNLIS